MLKCGILEYATLVFNFSSIVNYGFFLTFCLHNQFICVFEKIGFLKFCLHLSCRNVTDLFRHDHVSPADLSRSHNLVEVFVSFSPCLAYAKMGIFLCVSMCACSCGVTYTCCMCLYLTVFPLISVLFCLIFW
jgi:hypothetical protein